MREAATWIEGYNSYFTTVTTVTTVTDTATATATSTKYFYLRHFILNIVFNLMCLHRSLPIATADF